MKGLYQKVANQNESLKGLWAAKLNLSGNGSRVTQEDMNEYEKRNAQLEDELERRKDLGRKFEKVLIRMREIVESDEKAREEHQVSRSLNKISFIALTVL